MPKTRIMAFTWSTLKNLFSKPATKNYPAEPIHFPERSRGHIEIDIADCISCSMCERNCPTGAITVDRKAMTWGINRFDCLACGYCVLKCPKKCLHLVPGYQTPEEKKEEVSFQRPKPEPKPAAAKPAAGAGAGSAAAQKPAGAAAAVKPAAAGAPKAVLNGDVVTLANGKTMDLSKFPDEKKAEILKKLGIELPKEKPQADQTESASGSAVPKAAGAVLNGDIVTLPNGKTMDLSKLPAANREKVLQKLGLK